MPSTRTVPKAIDLALQGGGSHGALTWGVLDRLLEDDRLAIMSISGTSAGAMNAAVLADGFERGGREAARERLAEFWRSVSDAARFSPIQRSLWDRLSGNFSLDRSPWYLWFEQLSRTFSPYQLNPLDLNPLRDLLTASVDFTALNKHCEPRVFVAATNVRTGRARIFGPGELSVEAIMASACLPLMFKAVEIDGEAYWDGGYTGNPALYPLVDDPAARDIVIIQINPLRREALPRSSRDIMNRLNEITFNSNLLKELRAIHLLHQLIESEGLESERVRNMYLHLIHVHEELKDLDASSKLNAEWPFLLHLHEIGRRWADDWLGEHFDDLGRRSSFDLASLFADSFRPPDLEASARAPKHEAGS